MAIKEELRSIKSFFRLYTFRKKSVFLFVFFNIGIVVFGVSGVTSLLPVLQFIEKGPSVFDNSQGSTIWQLILYIINALHLPRTAGSLLLICFVPLVLKELASYLCFLYAEIIRYEAVTAIRENLFEKIARADLDFTVDQGAGKLMSAIMQESDRVGTGIVLLARLMVSLILILLYSVILFVFAFYLIIPIFIGAAMIFLIVMIFRKKSIAAGESISRYNNELGMFLKDKLYGLRIIKMMSCEPLEEGKASEVFYNLGRQ